MIIFYHFQSYCQLSLEFTIFLLLYKQIQTCCRKHCIPQFIVFLSIILHALPLMLQQQSYSQLLQHYYQGKELREDIYLTLPHLMCSNILHKLYTTVYKLFLPYKSELLFRFKNLHKFAFILVSVYLYFLQQIKKQYEGYLSGAKKLCQNFGYHVKSLIWETSNRELSVLFAHIGKLFQTNLQDPLQKYQCTLEFFTQIDYKYSFIIIC